MEVYKNLQDKEIKLETYKKPQFSYVPSVRTGNLLYTSGQDCRKDGELILEGKLGSDLSIDQGKNAAEQCIINCLSVLHHELGDLNRIKRVVKLLGFVQSDEGFKEQPFVMNGASDLLIEILGERGKHARSAIGTNELPFNTPVEVEMIVEVD